MKSMNWVQGQHGITHYMFVASLLFVSFSAMASAVRRFQRSGDDSFVLMNDVEQ